jgi:serine/threonine protein kinase
MAPEIVSKRPYDELVDSWGVGVIVLEMLTGVNPLAVTEKRDRDKMEREIANPPLNHARAGLVGQGYHVHHPGEFSSILSARNRME